MLAGIGKLMSPIVRNGGISEFGPLALLGAETSGMAIDFTVNQYAMRTFDAESLIVGLDQAMAIDFTTNTYAVRVYP